MGPITGSETLVMVTHSTLRNSSEEQRSLMMIWQRTPWFGSAGFGSGQSSLALHMQI